MKLLTYLNSDNAPRAGVIFKEGVYDLANIGAASGIDLPNTILEFIKMGEAGLAKVKLALAYAAERDLPRSAVKYATLLPPILNPPKILALAGNYQAHIQEGGGTPVNKSKVTPRVFMKPITTLAAHKQSVHLPNITQHWDYELELAIVIGRECKEISAEQAKSHIAGYAIYNDLSSRKLVIVEGRDARDGDGFFDWLAGKWQDGSGPMGPYVVTADELPNVMNLGMKLWVNDDLRQNGSTAQMIFDVYETVAFCSRLLTLQPGDVIATGTPNGVGAARNLYLKAGDVLRCEIEGLGTLENTVC